MRKPIIAIKLSPRNYSGLVTLGNHVVAALTGNVNYVTPLPALATVQTAITDVENAITAWGPPGDRGTKADLLDLRQKSLLLAQTLKSLSQYVQNTAQTAAGNDYEAMATILSTSGFGLANVPAPVGLLGPVEGFMAAKATGLNPNQVLLKWKRPLGVAKVNVYIYRILRAATAVYSDAVEIGTSSDTRFVDTNNTGAVQTYTYWVVAVNNLGDGEISNAVTVKVLDL